MDDNQRTSGSTVRGGTITALTGRIDPETAREKGYIHLIPPRWFDLARMGDLERQFRELRIAYSKSDVYPAFRSKEELDAALLAVYNSGWSDRWAIEEYLVEQELIERPKVKK